MALADRDCLRDVYISLVHSRDGIHDIKTVFMISHRDQQSYKMIFRKSPLRCHISDNRRVSRSSISFFLYPAMHSVESAGASFI